MSHIGRVPEDLPYVRYRPWLYGDNPPLDGSALYAGQDMYDVYNSTDNGTTAMKKKNSQIHWGNHTRKDR